MYHKRSYNKSNNFQKKTKEILKKRKKHIDKSFFVRYY